MRLSYLVYPFHSVLSLKAMNAATLSRQRRSSPRSHAIDSCYNSMSNILSTALTRIRAMAPRPTWPHFMNTVSLACTFFFQAEDGIRDRNVTGVQTCALPISELGMKHTRIPFVVLISGLVGAAVGFFMQYWSMAVDYPFDVGGRPPNSWPVFIPITFEVMVLVASLAALFGMMFLNGLPKLHRPIFNVPRFARASQDLFFLCIEASDPRFDRERTRQFLVSLRPAEIVEVDP